MHLEVLITLFQKMIWYIGVLTTLQEILTIKIFLKNADSAEIKQNTSTLNANISETISHSIINITIS